jgi:GDPmannose 4,6-dehydratase
MAGHGQIALHYGDMSDSLNIVAMINEVEPDEIYNLAAQSHVAVSFQMPEYTANTDGVGTLRILEAARLQSSCAKRSGVAGSTPKIYQASTSELYGKVLETPQSETTPFNPVSPYGAAKMYAYYITKVYREAYGMYACNGILFNHESPRRGETFVTRKITLAAARIAQGLQDTLRLGNLDAKRDWGHARDYVQCMHLILQEETPDDFVIATGETYTVREFCLRAFETLGMDIEFTGTGVDEKGIDKKTGRILIKVDPKYFRPAEVDLLLGNPTKAKEKLGWNPQQTSFAQLVEEMAKADYDLIKSGASTSISFD